MGVHREKLPFETSCNRQDQAFRHSYLSNLFFFRSVDISLSFPYDSPLCNCVRLYLAEGRHRRPVPLSPARPHRRAPLAVMDSQPRPTLMPRIHLACTYAQMQRHRAVNDRVELPSAAVSRRRRRQRRRRNRRGQIPPVSVCECARCFWLGCA